MIFKINTSHNFFNLFKCKFELGFNRVIFILMPLSFLFSSLSFAQYSEGNHWKQYLTQNSEPSIDKHLTDPILVGAVDIHVHSGPDAYPRQWDAFEVAKLASERGMRAILLKNHWTETAGLAQLVTKSVPDNFYVFGSVSMNSTVGGLNPRAILYTASVEGNLARIVWLPTHESEHEVLVDGSDRPSVIISENGELLPSLLEVLDTIAKFDLTLATGHLTPKETLKVMREAKERGISRIIVTHPALYEKYTYMNSEELLEAVSLGGMIEITAGSIYRGGDELKHALEVISLVGPKNIFVGSDSGLIGTPNVPDALVMSIHTLRKYGLTEEELNYMFRVNPSKMVKLN